MDYVHLVVPQHLYDELGLGPNQTVTLSNPQNEPHNVAINSEESQTADTVANNNAGDDDDVKATMSDPAQVLRVVVNAGNGKRKLLTYQLKSSSLLSDSESESDSSVIECACSGSDSDDSASFDAPLSENFEASQTPNANATQRVDENISVPSRRESHAIFQGLSVNAIHADPGRVKHLNPMFCATCCRGYLSKGSFRNHRKSCQEYAKNKRTKPLYPRLCENCGRTYPDSSGFCRHKATCEEYRAKKQAADSEGDSLETDAHRSQKSGKEKPVYPRSCPKCSWKCNNRNSYTYHLKTCGETKFAKNERDSYPKTCTACNQIYFCSATYTKHKEECSMLRQNVKGPELVPHQMEAVMDEWQIKDSGAGEDAGKWIPYSTNTTGKMQYFVVKKTTSS